jgi:hypothetical protein
MMPVLRGSGVIYGLCQHVVIFNVYEMPRNKRGDGQDTKSKQSDFVQPKPVTSLYNNLYWGNKSIIVEDGWLRKGGYLTAILIGTKDGKPQYKGGDFTTVVQRTFKDGRPPVFVPHRTFKATQRKEFDKNGVRQVIKSSKSVLHPQHIYFRVATKYRARLPVRYGKPDKVDGSQSFRSYKPPTNADLPEMFRDGPRKKGDNYRRDDDESKDVQNQAESYAQYLEELNDDIAVTVDGYAGALDSYRDGYVLSATEKSIIDELRESGFDVDRSDVEEEFDILDSIAEQRALARQAEIGKWRSYEREDLPL